MHGINNFKLHFWAGDTYIVNVLKGKWPYNISCMEVGRLFMQFDISLSYVGKTHRMNTQFVHDACLSFHFISTTSEQTVSTFGVSDLQQKLSENINLLCIVPA